VAELGRTDLKNQINQNIVENNNQDITATILNGILIDTADSAAIQNEQATFSQAKITSQVAIGADYNPNQLYVYADATDYVTYLHNDNISGNGLLIAAATPSTNALLIRNNSSADQIVVKGDGKIGIGLGNATDPTEQLDMIGNMKVDGDATFTGDVIANNIAAPSDIAFKENIQIQESVLDKYFGIDLVNYNYKNDDQKRLGVIAQQVEEVFPEVVLNKNGKKYVDYSQLAVTAIAAVKELNQRLEILEKLVN
jgi:hypothetical protein